MKLTAEQRALLRKTGREELQALRERAIETLRERVQEEALDGEDIFETIVRILVEKKAHQSAGNNINLVGE